MQPKGWRSDMESIFYECHVTFLGSIVHHPDPVNCFGYPLSQMMALLGISCGFCVSLCRGWQKNHFKMWFNPWRDVFLSTPSDWLLLCTFIRKWKCLVQLVSDEEQGIWIVGRTFPVQNSMGLFWTTYGWHKVRGRTYANVLRNFIRHSSATTGGKFR